jgi:hypothetical protein
MDTFARREGLAETDRAQKRLDNPRRGPIPEEDSPNRQAQPPGPVRPDAIREGAGETFDQGAGI